MAQTSECNICTEKLNKVKHTPIKCEYCDFEACRQCCQTYILDKTQATCMNNQCNKEWSRKFLAEKFTQKFVNTEWKKNREQVLFDKEKALLPATQPLVERRIQEGKIKAQIRDIEKQIRDLNTRRMDLQQMLYNPNYIPLDPLTANPNNTDPNTNPTNARHFVRACPDEHCRGYLSTQWKCGLCEKWTCPDCHAIKGHHKDTEHVCNKDDLETAKLLDQDTKPCPKCATGIYKIEGCDQMWCTQCHTAFSWRTGRIETRIHNPHYFEFLRRANNGDAPRNPDEINFVCGQELDYRTARQIDRQLLANKIPKETINYIGRIIQSTLHLHEVQAEKYRVDDVENNQELRISYLQNAIDEPKFKQLVQQANKRHEKNREIGEILGLFHQTMTEIILRFSQQLDTVDLTNTQPNTQPNIQTTMAYINEIKGLQQYANTCFQEIAKTYGGKPKMIQFYEHLRGNVDPKKTRNERYPIYNRDVLVTVV